MLANASGAARGAASVGVGAGPLFGAALLVLLLAVALLVTERARQHSFRRRRDRW